MLRRISSLPARHLLQCLFLSVLLNALPDAKGALSMLDNFSSGNLNHWTALGGTWINNQNSANQTSFVPYGTSPGQLLEWNGPVGNSFSVQADMMIPVGSAGGSDSVGLAFNIKDANNYDAVTFFPGFPGGALRFIQVVGGVFQGLGGGGNNNNDMGFTPAVGSYYTLRLDKGANNLCTVSIWNGTDTSQGPAYSLVTSLFSLTSGGVGLWNEIGTGSFKNFEGNIAVIPEPATWVAGVLLLVALACSSKTPSQPGESACRALLQAAGESSLRE